MAELHLFDFDGTLFRSPYEPAVWEGDWWNEAQSLLPPCVPDHPDSSWWVADTVRDARRSCSDQDVYAVLATGRAYQSGLRYRVPELLKQQGLHFDEVHLAPPAGTLAFKKRLIRKILATYSFIDTFRVWDDRMSHLPEFRKAAIASGINPENIYLHPVKARPKDPECDPLVTENSAHQKEKPGYLGLFLDAASKADLVHAFGYAHHKTRNDHVTLALRPSGEMLKLVGQRGSAIVTGYVEDDQAQAVVVSLPPELQLGERIPHVTLSLAEGVEAKYSNDLVRKGDIQPVERNLVLSGVVDVFPRSLSPARVAARYLERSGTPFMAGLVTCRQ